MDNPYWEQVQSHVAVDNWYQTPQVQRWNTDCGHFSIDGYPNREELVARYAWCVTDPATIDFIAAHARGGLVDPMAGTGYWAYLLNQAGVDVVSYDLEPGSNAWHGDKQLFTEITALDGALAVAMHRNRTLFMSWPPYSEDVGARILNAYRGRRVIFIGEGHGGCTGDDDLYETLERHWTEVAEHIPVQWFGVHDHVYVYKRALPRLLG